MPKRSANEYASDDGFVQDGSASPPHNSKRTKTNGSSRKPNEDKIEINTAVQKDENGDDFWELNPGGTRRVTLNEFKGKTLVNVREYYESNGKKLPGKKVGNCHQLPLIVIHVQACCQGKGLYWLEAYLLAIPAAGT